MIGAISTALTGLLAATQRVGVSASNIANLGSSGSLDPQSPNQPYQALTTVQTANQTGGTTSQVIPKKPGIVNAYAPDSPFANNEGLVGTPNVDLAEEAVNLKLAEISYKANLSVLKAAQDTTEDLLNIVNKKV